MKWFENKRKRLEMISTIKPTSKATLKMQCLMACKGNIDEAMKLYDFFAKDMPQLPDYDPVAPTWVDNTKDMASGIFGWLKENQTTVVQAYQFVQQLIANKGALPTINPEVSVGDPLPPIN